MQDSTALYRTFYTAEDRFTAEPSLPGFEPDVIFDYIQSGLDLASLYNKRAAHPNRLLEELFLRRVFYRLLSAIDDEDNSRIFRRVCLDNIYGPLLALKRHYSVSDAGYRRFLILEQELRNVQYSINF
nr:hypothetical protein [Thaumasiovibrio subtropicus]